MNTRMLAVSLFCLGAVAVAEDNPVIACNPKAIAAAERPRYQELTKRLRTAARDRRELANGYALLLEGKEIALVELAEWIGFERKCCPFLTFELVASGNKKDWTLRLTGPEGTKAVLTQSF